jgi:hypothetical protein
MAELDCCMAELDCCMAELVCCMAELDCWTEELAVAEEDADCLAMDADSILSSDWKTASWASACNTDDIIVRFSSVSRASACCNAGPSSYLCSAPWRSHLANGKP